jgi:hypothetical protein
MPFILAPPELVPARGGFQSADGQVVEGVRLLREVLTAPPLRWQPTGLPLGDNHSTDPTEDFALFASG